MFTWGGCHTCQAGRVIVSILSVVVEVRYSVFHSNSMPHLLPSEILSISISRGDQMLFAYFCEAFPPSALCTFAAFAGAHNGGPKATRTRLSRLTIGLSLRNSRFALRSVPRFGVILRPADYALVIAG